MLTYTVGFDQTGFVTNGLTHDATLRNLELIGGAALFLEGRKSFRVRYLKPALADSLIEMTIFNKPNSHFQKYRLNDKDRH